MMKTIICILSLIISGACVRAQQELFPPNEITKCLQLVGGPFEIIENVNPFYLRGDFWGTGKMSYVVRIRQSTPLQAGVVLCPMASSPVVLMHGWSGKFASKDIAAEGFVAPSWKVYSKGYSNALLKRNHHPGTAVGESVAMIWEDGIGLLYSDGSKLRWVSGLQ